MRKYPVLILCLLSLEYNDVALKEYEASDPLLFTVILRVIPQTYVDVVFQHEIYFNKQIPLCEHF